MSAASRRKGLTGEREVAAIFEGEGFHVRGLESGGDCFVAIDGNEYDSPIRYHIEVKRYARRARWPEWWEQANGDAAPGTPPLLCTRADRGEWLVTLRLADLLDVIA